MPEPTNPLVDTAWAVVAGLDLPAGAAVTLVFADDVVSGLAGCNSYRAGYELWSDRLRIPGPIATTAKACPPPLDILERDVLRRLERVAAFRFRDGGLDLLDERGRLLFELRRQGVSDLVGTWRVSSLHRPERQAVASVEGDLAVVFDDGEVYGHAGCNTFRGSWAVTGTTVVIGPLATTRRACAAPVMAQEQDLLLGLERARGFRLTGDRLDLLRPDGGTAVSLRRHHSLSD